MVQDFRSFLQSLGAAMPQELQQAPQPAPAPVPQPMPVPPPQPAPQPMPTPPPQQAQPLRDTSPQALLAAITAIQQQQQQMPMPAAPPMPVQQVGQQQGAATQPLTPTQFAMMNNLRQPQVSEEPEREEETGEWQSVEYQYQGVTYHLLMPVENAAQAPEGANPVGPVITEPERIKRAEEEGNKERPPGQFVGLLSQAPPEIQAVFGMRIKPPPGVEPPPTASPEVLEGVFPTRPPENTVAPVNEAGETPQQIIERMTGAIVDETEQRIGDIRPGYIDEQGNIIPDLTTEQLRKTDPVKAALLESQYIYRVPVNQMVVQDQDGVLRLVEQSETAPEGTEIITYGGRSPELTPRGERGSMLDDNKLFGIVPLPPGPIGTGIEAAIEGPVAMVSPALGPLEVPQRKYQEGMVGYADIISQLPEPIQQVVTGSISSIPGFEMGSGEFIQWQLENRDIVEEVRQNGYTDPATGQTFDGDRAIWERFEADRNIVQRTVDTVATDPLNVVPSLGAPARSAASTILRNVDEAGPIAGAVRRGAGETLNAVADIADIPENILGAAADVAVSGVRNVARQAERLPLFQQTDETIRRNVQEETETQLADLESQRNTALIAEPEARHVFPTGETATKNDEGLWTLVDQEGEEIVSGGSWDAVQLRMQERTAPAPTTPADEAIAQPEIVQPEPVPGRWVRQPDGEFVRVPVTAADEAVAQPGVVQPEPVTVSRAATATAAETPPTPTQAPLPEAPAPTPVDPLEAAMVRAQRRQQAERPVTQQELPTDRPITDLGQAPDQRTDVAQELPTDRPVEDLGTEDSMAIRRESEFLQTDVGRKTQTIMDTWPEFVRPQTVAERQAGVGRTGPVGIRPVEVARALAPERPEAFERFVTEANLIAKRFTNRESARRMNRQWGAVRRTTTDTVEDGFDLKRAYEVVLEADANVPVKRAGIYQKFIDHFGDDAPLPEYSWKRWKNQGEEGTHTALETIDQNGGNYTPSTPLHEAVEIAIYHPDDAVARAALDDIQYRMGVHKSDGTLVEANGNVKLDTKFPDEFKSTDGGGNILNAIPKYRAKYQSLLEESANRATPERMETQDVADLSRITTTEPEVAAEAPEAGQEVFEEAMRRSDEEAAREIDPTGARVADLQEAGTAFTDATRPGPQALPFRSQQGLQDIEAIPLGPPGWSGRPQAMQGPQAPLQGPRALQPDELARVQEGGVTPEAYRSSVESVRQFRAQTRTQEAPPTRGEQRRAEREAGLSPVRQRRTLANRTTTMRPDELQSFYVRGRLPSAKQMQTLGQEFADGESMIERWDRYTDEILATQDVSAVNIADAESQAKVRVLNDWAVENLNAKEMARYEKEFSALKKKKREDGTARTDMEARIDALEKVHEREGRTRGGYWWDRFMSGLRELFLYNPLTGPRYISTQALGNSVTAILTGHYDIVNNVISPRAVKQAWETSAKNGELPTSIMDDARTQWGLGGERRMTRGSNVIRDQTEQGIGKAMTIESVPGLGRVSRALGMRKIRDMAIAFDMMPREALWVNIMDTNLLRARQTLRDRMWATKPAEMTREQFDEMFDALPQRFSASDVRETFGAVNNRWADRHARDWQEALTKTDKAARDEVKRVFFDGGERNIDRALKRVFFFHYWMSRATPLYTEAIIRNPVYFYNYLNLLEAIDEDRDFSGTDFAKWLKTPMGYNVLIRPDAFFQAFGSFWEDAGYTPEGESRLGAMIRKSPVMVNPIMQSVVNMLGMSGDTFAPDPFGANKFIQFAQAGIDYANAEFGLGLGPVGNPSDDMLTWARSQISGTLDFLPGINEVPYSDPMAYKENEVRAIVAEIGLERGLPVDDPLVQAAMMDSESEMYQEAMKRYSKQDLMDIGLRILPVTAVLYPKSQLEGPKQRTESIAEGRDPITGDYTPEAIALMQERDTIAAATPYSQELQRQEQEYRTIGTPEQRGAWRVYNNIRYGSGTATVYIGGTGYPPQALQVMGESEREALADQWAENTGNAEVIEEVRALRADYRETHKEYADYSQWQNQIGDYEGGPQQWWLDTIEGNPNARRWYEGQSPEQQQNEVNLTSTEAYMAWEGEKRSYWEPEPTATRTEIPPGPYNPIGDTGDRGSGSSSSDEGARGPTKDLIMEQIAEYEAEMAEYNRIASEMLGGDQQINVDWINPQARSAVIANLESVGIQKPRMGGYLYDYTRWAETQQDGDFSVEAYIRYYREQNPEEEETEEEGTEPTAAD